MSNFCAVCGQHGYNGTHMPVLQSHQLLPFASKIRQQLAEATNVRICAQCMPDGKVEIKTYKRGSPIWVNLLTATTIFQPICLDVLEYREPPDIDKRRHLGEIALAVAILSGDPEETIRVIDSLLRLEQSVEAYKEIGPIRVHQIKVGSLN